MRRKTGKMDDLERFIAEEIERDPEFKAEYEASELEYQIACQIIRIRTELGLTQKQVATLMGTRQSAVSRLESGLYNPTIAVLREVASALNANVEIKIVPNARKPKPKSDGRATVVQA